MRTTKRRFDCTVKPVTTGHPLVPAKAVFSSRWSLVRGLYRATIYGSHYMICISKCSYCNSPRLAHCHSCFRSNKTWRERWRAVERQRERERRLFFLQTSNSAPTSEARSQMFPVEVSFCAGLQICSCDQSYRLSLLRLSIA